MKSVLYHQKEFIDSHGRKRYIGEDTYPYADEELIIVADGLGGRGGYPHTKINHDILNRDKFYDIVFAPVFCADVSNEFKNYVIGIFDEVFKTKDYYFENTSFIRCSGYFASRLASAITLYEMKYNHDFDKKNVFFKVHSVSQEERVAVVQQLGDELARLIYEKLSQIANNVGFEIETKITGAYLLPTTIVATLVDDCEDYADVIYFWAGDSRGYIWNENGLAQVTDDHEENETMTNIITLTKPFKIEATYIRVEKPCVLFNATDGCYKCSVFSSPFDLEYVFLKSIDDSDSFDDAVNILYNKFGEIGQHDDSNTMAISALGFENYQGVQNSVRKRLTNIEETIIAKLPGILMVNYPEELGAMEEKISGGICKFNERLISEERIVIFVKNDMIANEYIPLLREKNDLSDKKNSCVKRQNELEKAIEKWVEKYWIRKPQLKRYSTAADKFKSGLLGFGRENPYEKYSKLQETLDLANEAHEKCVSNIIEKLDLTYEKLKNELEQLTDIKNTVNFDDYTLTQNKISMMEVIEFCKDVSKRETPYIQKHKSVSREIDELNHYYVTNDADAILVMKKSILEKKFDINTIEISMNAKERITEVLKEYETMSEEIRDIELEINGLPDKHFMSYWEKNNERLVKSIWMNHRDLLSEELKECFSEDIIDLQKSYMEMKKCCELREQIYSEYEQNYRRVYRESRI